jgi:hypothetical protein
MIDHDGRTGSVSGRVNPSPGRLRFRCAHGVLLVIVAGMLLRLYHYARDPSMWHDEAAFVLNVLQKSFGELLGPLRFAEAAPPLFLWVERAVSLALGDGTFALRLVPFVASCLVLVLVAWAGRSLGGTTFAVSATLLIAASDRLLWHCCEAKPYAIDAFCAAGLLALYLAVRDQPLRRQFIIFAALVPVVIWLSYPGCFLLGGVALSFVPRLRRERRRGAWIGWFAFGAIVVGSFAALYLGPAQAQRCGTMEQCWTGQFPDWSRPASVPLWSLASILDIYRYCFAPAGYLLIGFALVGMALLWRQGRGDFLLLALTPIGLNLIAALAHAYPFGGCRVCVHAAPALALVIAAGIETSVMASARPGRVFKAIAITLLLLPTALTAYRLVVPWDRFDCAGASTYVDAHRQPGERVYGNHWEVEYYFRHDLTTFALLPAGDLTAAERYWLILASARPEDREALLESLANGRRVADRRDFRGVTAALLIGDN